MTGAPPARLRQEIVTGPAPVMISARNVHQSFGSVHALRGVDLTVGAGEIVALLGHNGAGKTTLVNVLCTVRPATAGTIRVAGFDVATEGARVRSRIGVTGQFASLDEQLTGVQNLVLIGRLLGAGRRQATARARELIEAFDLGDAASRSFQSYSGGMRRRLDLAASLVGRPQVLFLDEPTTGLDPVARLNLWAMVEELARAGTAVLLTTQYLEEADRLADRITVLDHGRVIASASSADLKASVGTRSIHAVLAPGVDPDSAITALCTAGAEPVFDPERRALTVPARDSADLAFVVRTLDSVGADVSELGFRESSLDDVYLSLTGARSG